ncbi:MAG: pyruvate dehydrogenase complex dihydrolipoamide acetyltransferase [Sphingomonadales bacterium]|jgi:pyruvate dehydrogenase E2 component (dihydrolipoamide acetyltransferase)|nr:pyruvate dehydrogenase complex dihydrolipoamide acetyltransferase [Sphingomonadales bacterium]MBL0023013.1 pyruvate dehydrogenase complex dihydrolipoamide acetyltransferase [Sphingomonadales bacterium]
MPIELKMPALSPTMEEGTLARWLVKEGDSVSSGDLIAEIETDKATMEFEAVDEGVISKIMVAEGSEGVKVGTVIALIQGEDEGEAPKADVKLSSPPVGEDQGGGRAASAAPMTSEPAAQTTISTVADATGPHPNPSPQGGGARIKASPLAKRIASDKGIDLSSVSGTGPGGRIVKADLEGAKEGVAVKTVSAEPVEARPTAESRASTSSALPVEKSTALTTAIPDFGIPFEDAKLSGMRKTIAKRLTQSMVEAPHIYLTVDIRLDALLKLRGELNEMLADRGIKLSVNDMLIKALGLALIKVPACNVSFGGDVLRSYKRADVSVAVSIPGGLITPIVIDAAGKSLSTIATEAKDLANRAKEGKLQPTEYQGGTASISNMGMMGIKQFTAVINPPQAMIMAVGAGEKRPYVMDDGSLGVATVMCCTGSFDHRAIDGADGAQLMAAFKTLVEKPLGLVA